MDKSMQTGNLTDDAKAILLLCGRFGKNDAARPLSLGRGLMSAMPWGVISIFTRWQIFAWSSVPRPGKAAPGPGRPRN